MKHTRVIATGMHTFNQQKMMNYLTKGMAAICVALLMTPLSSNAQTNVTIGTGTGYTTSQPIYTFDNYSASESIYLASEFGTVVGDITAIAYDKKQLPNTSVQPIPNVTIYMKYVSESTTGPANRNISLNGYTQVWSGTFPNSVSGWQEVVLNSPFPYGNNGQNLSVLVVNNSNAIINQGRPQYIYTTTNGEKRNANYHSTTAPWNNAATLSSVWERPNTKFTFQGSAVPVAPVVYLGNDTATCLGNSITLNAGNTGSTYLWNNNATTQTISVNAGGTYYVKVTNASNISATDTINIMMFPKPLVNLGNDTFFCEGSNITLNAANAGASYSWSNAATSQTISASTAGKYYVTVTNAHGCKSSDTISIAVNDAPEATGIRVSEAGKDLSFEVKEPAYITTYIWNFGDGTSNSNLAAPAHSYAASGTYTVNVRLGNICGDTLLATTVTIHPTGIMSPLATEDALLLYPNPAANTLTIENETSTGINHIHFVNIIGQVVLKYDITNEARRQSIDISGLPVGSYFLQVISDGNTTSRKINIIR